MQILELSKFDVLITDLFSVKKYNPILGKIK